MTGPCTAAGRMLLILLVGALVAGCATKVTTGAFAPVNRLESELQRGISTKMDARRILGTPKGFGSAVLPTNPKPREVWYYEDVELTDARFEGGGVIRANVRQQGLLLFFDKEVFDGFMWFSNAGVATGE